MAAFDLVRLAPSGPLEEFVESYWIIVWDRAGAPPYRQSNLPHPSQHLVVDPAGATGIFGISTRRFDYVLSGSGRIFGVKFRPGGFYPFCRRPLIGLADRHMPIGDVFDAGGRSLDERLLSLADPASMIGPVEDLLMAGKPQLDEGSRLAGEIVGQVASLPGLTNVSRLAAHAGLSLRSLQRLFTRHVGIGPKWVIDRYRMLEALDAMEAGNVSSLADIAISLGYFDQAHFSKVFRALTGRSPGRYLASSSDGSSLP